MTPLAPTMATGGAPDRVRPSDVYGEAVSAAREIYRVLKPEEKSPQALPWPENIVRKIWALLQTGDQEILALTNRSVSDHFLYGHVANITVLALRLGVAVGTPEEEAITLGLGAFLHDLGLAAHMELAAKPTRITDEEHRHLRTHLEEGMKLLDLFPLPDSEIKNTIRQVIGQSHERWGGKGYPERLSSESIHPFAKIIGLVDVYESLTHMRPWRPRRTPHEVLRTFIEEGDEGFDPELVRVLVESLSLYPPGSFVRLNTGEVGRVTATHPELPLRPKAWMMMGADGRRLDPHRLVNLATTPALFVAEAVDETTLSTSDPQLKLELRAQCWWVKGL